MDLLKLLPPEIKSHIFKMMSHPIADLFKKNLMIILQMLIFMIIGVLNN